MFPHEYFFLIHSLLVIDSFIKRQNSWTPDSLKMMSELPPTSQFSEEKYLHLYLLVQYHSQKGAM